MMSIRSKPFILCSLWFLTACSQARNHPEASVIVNQNGTLIKLKGTRLAMAHDPVSALLRKTYEDSLLIPIPRLTDSLIQGKDIPVMPDYPLYTGEVIINANHLTVALFYDTLRQRACEWNGKYSLAQKYMYTK